jgi:trehalose utilization protein
MMTDKPTVGIYWIVPDTEGTQRLLGHACALADAEDYGDCLTYPSAHIDVWTQWQRGKPPEKNFYSLIRQHEYEDWPRGRIVYDRSTQHFIVYADPQVIRRPVVMEAIIHWFALPEGLWIVRTDAHYRSRMRL